MSTIYKDRDRDRDSGGRSYTTVRRYHVPDRDEGREVVEEKKIVIKREREAPPRETREHRYERDVEREREPLRRDVEYRVVEREREVEREPAPRRDFDYRVIEREREIERSPPARESRDIRYEREILRAPSPPQPERVREYRFERDIEREPPRRDPYELERYSRSTEYFAQPQPIIIRQDAQPIIIREPARQPIVLQREEPRYEFIEREEVRDQQIVRREEPPPPSRREEPSPSPPPPSRKRDDEENYYYERKTREVARDDRPYRSRHDVEPRESASQYGDDHYSSEDDTYIVRRTVESSRSRSPNHRRHLAEGAIAGIGAAELLRHHKKRQGEDPGHRGRTALGGAALGAVGAEVLSRARSRARSSRGSRSRSSSSDRSYRSSRRGKSRRRKHKSRSRSKSRSKSRVRQLAGLGAVAAVGAVAAYALRNRQAANQPVMIERRSRSRRRRGSFDSTIIEERPGSAAPKNRNARVAQAGLATAAAAGIWQRMRSKSRGGKSRSQSRLRTGVPIAAAGLGGAAVAGLYQRNQARKEARRENALGSERSRSRSRSRSVPYPDDDPHMRRAASDAALIEYGGDPIHTDRRYDDEPGEYHRRHRGYSSESSPDGRQRNRNSSRSRSRSRRRGLAEAAAAAGVAGAAAHEVTKRNERKRAERRREWHQSEKKRAATDTCIGRDDESDYGRDNSPPYSPPPMGPNAGEYPPQHEEFYPSTNTFPPPPSNNYGGREADYGPGGYPPYNPNDFPPPPGSTTPQPGTDHRYADPNLGYPQANETYAGDTRYEHGQHDPRDRSGPENVSPDFGNHDVDDPHGAFPSV